MDADAAVEVEAVEQTMEAGERPLEATGGLPLLEAGGLPLLEAGGLPLEATGGLPLLKAGGRPLEATEDYHWRGLSQEDYHHRK